MKHINGKVRSLLLAALMITSVLAGSAAGAANSLGSASAESIAADDETATQDVSFDVTIDENSSDTILIDASEFETDGAELLAAGASSESESVVVDDTSVSDDEVEIDLINENNGSDSATITVTIVADTTDIDAGSSYEYGLTADDGDVSTSVSFDTDDGAIDDSSVVYQGEDVSIDVSGLGEDLELRELDDNTDYDGDDDSTLVREVEAGDDGVLDLETDDLDEGTDYVITDSNDSDAVQFEVAEDSLDADFDDAEISQEGTTSLEFDGDRADQLVEISADGLDEDDLEDLFGDNGEYVATNDEDSSVYVEVGPETELEIDDASDIDAGDYDFDIRSVEASDSDDDDDNGSSEDGTSTSASLSISGVDGYDFTETAYTDQVGDEASFTVLINDDSDAYVFVGSESANYLEIVHVQESDDDDDRRVTITMDTFAAGQEANGSEDAYDVEGDDNLLGVQRISTEEIPDGLDEPLEAGEYDLRLATSDEYDADGDEAVDEEGLSVLDLSEQNDNDGENNGDSDARTWIAEADDAGSFDGAAQLRDEVTESDTVAAGDRVVLEFDATGITGILEDEDVDTLNQPDAGVDFDIVTDEDLNEVDENETEGENESVFDLNSSNAELYVDDGEDKAYVVIDTSQVDGLEDGEDYTASLTVGDQEGVQNGEGIDESPYPYSDDGERATLETSFDFEDVDVSFEDTTNGDVEVGQGGSATVTASTNLAPGTEIDIELRSDDGQAFLDEETVDVGENGAIEAEFDTSDLNADATFDITVTDDDGEVVAEEDGVIAGSNGSDDSNDNNANEGNENNSTNDGNEGTDANSNDVGANEVAASASASAGSDLNMSGVPLSEVGIGILGLLAGFGVVAFAARRFD